MDAGPVASDREAGVDTTVGRVDDVLVIVVPVMAVVAATEFLVVDRVVGKADLVPLVVYSSGRRSLVSSLWGWRRRRGL